MTVVVVDVAVDVVGETVPAARLSNRIERAIKSVTRHLLQNRAFSCYCSACGALSPKIPEIVPCSETRTFMPLFTAYEDFTNRTLGVLKGTWERLMFMTKLRGEKGRYAHWGLEYTYGPMAAKKALSQAHAEIFRKTLETPIPALAREFERDPAISTELMIPEDRDGCLPEHFRYLHTALTLLADAHSSHRAA